MVAVGVCAMPAVPADPAFQIVINEVELNPAGRDAGKEWVELLNIGDSEVDLAGWSITYTYRVPGTIVLSEEALMIEPGEFFVFTYPRLMLRNAEPSTIELRDPDGNVVHSASSLADEENDGRTWQRISLGDDPLLGDLWLFREATKGKAIE
jgi:hypothetical protein